MESDEPPQSDETMRLNAFNRESLLKPNSHPAVLIHINEDSPIIWELKKGKYRIGRNPELEIFIDSRGMSRLHAYLEVSEGSVVIQDNESTNGILVNGTPVQKASLKHNDIISLGESDLKFIPEGQLELAYLSSLYKTSQCDDLTGCLRKDPFISLINNEIRRFKIEHDEFSLLFIDLDNFKKVNDFAGHLGGDYVLKTIAKLLKEKALRDSDSICRYGGDEFIIFLSNTSKEKSLQIATRVKNIIEQFPFTYEDKILHVTISVGVSSCTSEDENIEHIIAEVDKKMYLAKKQGRNMVVG